ncbi:MAG: hypothetical protein F6K44_20860, partial [Moorea sp. SIO3E2]|nr:hypothetical protein [Moorena sp. SIO3E2]
IRCSHIRCSLLPAPCSLLPAPCSLLPAPCSLLPAPCSLLPKNLGALSVGELNSPRVAPQKFVPHQS